MGRGRRQDPDGGQPIEPGEARAHGNDPDAVEVHSRGGSSDRTGYREGDVGRREGDFRDSGYTETSRGYSGGSGSAREGEVRRRGSGDGGRGEELAAQRRDSVRWGPIWAGLITALTTFLLLQLLAVGLGLVDIGPGSQGGGGWVLAIIGLIAFFTGGAVAGMTSAIRGAATGFLNGLLVWALGTVLILALSALGLGQLFGALGNVAGQVGPGALSNVANTAQDSAQQVDPAEAAQALRNGALGAFFGLLFSALAAALGGYLGGRSKDPIGRPTDIGRE